MAWSQSTISYENRLQVRTMNVNLPLLELVHRVLFRSILRTDSPLYCCVVLCHRNISARAHGLSARGVGRVLNLYSRGCFCRRCTCPRSRNATLLFRKTEEHRGGKKEKKNALHAYVTPQSFLITLQEQIRSQETHCRI